MEMKEKVNNMVRFDKVSRVRGRWMLCATVLNHTALVLHSGLSLLSQIVWQATYEKLMSEVPTYRMITPSVLSDRLRVSCESRLSAWLDAPCDCLSNKSEDDDLALLLAH